MFTHAGMLSNSSVVIKDASLINLGSLAGFFACSGSAAFVWSSLFAAGPAILENE